MNENSDAQLLRDYAGYGRETAFHEIVTRHADFVYSAALRQVEASDIAADLTQTVFVDLARKAQHVSNQLPPHASLAGWLYRSTRYAALNHLRDTRRRRTNERLAMEQLLTDSEPAVNWEQIRPVLDEAMDTLSDEDREALLLRYFKNLDFRTTGLTLGVSDDAAQKRVSRALERLREFFTKRNVTIGASGLAVLISANAVQSAPIGLMVTISAAAVLTGTAVSTSAVVAATKTIAMTAFQKIIVLTAFSTALGIGIFEKHQAAQLQNQIQRLQQQQSLLPKELSEWQTKNIDTANQLAVLIAENERLKSNPDKLELLKLRGEISQLKEIENLKANDPTVAAAKSWLDRIDELKEYLKQHPSEKIPEFQFLTEPGWLSATDPSMSGSKTADYYRTVTELLKFRAQEKFGVLIQMALSKYASANDGQFPTDLSQLQPYCDANVADLMEQLYEIKPATILPASQVKEMSIKSDWVVVRKERAVRNSTSRGAYFANGDLWWQSPVGKDD
ncbi:MAG TPA: sigma-70 family RNA polymerase sigma factor [Verrucomicrobiae bacterium]